MRYPAAYVANAIRVYQLKGGIHNYLEEFGKKGDGLWIGDNYTFDKRCINKEQISVMNE